jgi:hypothetical protein
MTRPSAWIACLVPLMAVAPLALVQCSGGDGSLVGSKTTTKTDASIVTDDASSAPPPGDDAGSPQDGGPGPSSDGSPQPPAGDASPDAAPGPTPIPVPEGGAPSDPGSVLCNGSACDVSQGNSCCVQPVDGGSKETCNPPNTPCGGGVKRECNEAADCNSGVCCQAINGIALVGSATCMAGPSCPGNTFQTCRVNKECGGGGDGGARLDRCIPQTCTNTMPPRTLKIEACAVPATGMNAGGTLGYCTAD